MDIQRLTEEQMAKLVKAFGVSTVQSAFRDDKKARALGVSPIAENVQLRNINVGMFSGPRPSYQRYSAGPNATDVVRKVK